MTSKRQSSRPIEVEVAADTPAARPHFEKVAGQIQAAAVSPSGVRAAFEAHGEILTVPAEKGDIRNLTSSPAAADRDPAWSPDGQSVAYFSDESGEYQLHIRSQGGLGDVRKIDLGSPPSFFYSPIWSPDGKKIAFTDKRRNLWYVEVEKGAPVKVDSDRYEDILRGIDPSWSPDSRFLAYTMPLENHMRSVFIYSLETKKSTRLTDGMSDARFPVFDRNGEHLYFTASTDFGLSVGWLDLSSYERPVRRSPYVAVLKKGLPSPIAPESDEEDARAGAGGRERRGSRSDPGRRHRLRRHRPANPRPSRSRGELRRNAGGKIGRAVPSGAGAHPARRRVPAEAHGASLPPRGPEDGEGRRGSNRFRLSRRTARKYLYKLADKWMLSGTEEGAEPRELALEAMEVHVDPKAEWRQMYRETWRIQRDFLYDPAFHGLDLAAASEKYEGFLERVSSRADLNFLFEEMLGELTLGHVFVAGGDLGDKPQVKGGLLGADYAVENGRYRFRRIFNGESWNPNLRAPLTQPGVEVAEGDYLLEVNGKDVRPPASLYSFFENTAGRQVRLKVGPSADGARAREVTVVPVEDEAALRRQAWIEDNRRKVDKLSGGRLAYVHLPDTATGGYTSFNRYFFAQIGKEGAILDERYNHGGSLADYIIDLLKRPLRTCMTTRDGEDYCSPTAAIYGPKTMIINEMAGSGGDALPWMFRLDKARAARGKADLGRPRRHLRLPAAHGRRHRDRAAHRNLRAPWRMGSGERRHRSRRRGRERSEVRRRGTRPSARARGRDHARSVEDETGNVTAAPDVPELPHESLTIRLLRLLLQRFDHLLRRLGLRVGRRELQELLEVAEGQRRSVPCSRR